MKLPEPKAPAAGVNVNDPSAARATEPKVVLGCETRRAVRGPGLDPRVSLPKTPGAITVEPAGGMLGRVNVSLFAVGGVAAGIVSVTVACELVRPSVTEYVKVALPVAPLRGLNVNDPSSRRFTIPKDAGGWVTSFDIRPEA